MKKKMIPLVLAAQMLWADPPSLTIDPSPSLALDLPSSSELPKNHHVYFDVGAMYVFPQLGAGFRQQNGYWGYDLTLKGSALPLPIGSGSIRTVVWLPWISGRAHLLYYPRPNLESQWYVGGGIVSPYFSVVWPNVVFGKSYQTAEGKDRFWQIGAEFAPGGFIPIVSFSYGFCL